MGGGGGGQFTSLHGTFSPSHANWQAAWVLIVQAPVAWSQHAPVGGGGGGQVVRSHGTL